MRCPPAFSVVMYVDSIIGMKLFSLSYLTGWVDMCYRPTLPQLKDRPFNAHHVLS